jgi:hypothetical protein
MENIMWSKDRSKHTFAWESLPNEVDSEEFPDYIAVAIH